MQSYTSVFPKDIQAMNLDYSAEDRQFRDEVRAFLRNHLPDADQRRVCL